MEAEKEANLAADAASREIKKENLDKRVNRALARAFEKRQSRTEKAARMGESKVAAVSAAAAAEAAAKKAALDARFAAVGARAEAILGDKAGKAAEMESPKKGLNGFHISAAEAETKKVCCT